MTKPKTAEELAAEEFPETIFVPIDYVAWSRAGYVIGYRAAMEEVRSKAEGEPDCFYRIEGPFIRIENLERDD